MSRQSFRHVELQNPSTGDDFILSSGIIFLVELKFSGEPQNFISDSKIAGKRFQRQQNRINDGLNKLEVDDDLHSSEPCKAARVKTSQSKGRCAGVYYVSSKCFPTLPKEVFDAIAHKPLDILVGNAYLRVQPQCPNGFGKCSHCDKNRCCYKSWYSLG